MLIHPQFDDPYSRGGLAEKTGTFVVGQQIEQRLMQGPLVIGELGFGQGLAFLATYLAALRVGGRFTFVSFEQYPLDWVEVVNVWCKEMSTLPEELRGIETWPALQAGCNRFMLPHCELEIWVGDARTLITETSFNADAWFLDGHAPAKNPELWEAGLLRVVGARSKAGATVSTYSCARVVREHLAAAGFDATRVPGFGVKRRMVVGKKVGG